MTPFLSLWLPLLVSSVAVFIASSLIHMISPWHKGDYTGIPGEDKVLDLLAPLNIPPGDYMVPHPAKHADMKSPEYLEKRRKGPVMIVTVVPNGDWNMGAYFVKWFLYILAVGAVAGCIACSTLVPGAYWRPVFHLVSAVSAVGYTMALWQMSIWYHRGWGITIKATVDGVIYALITGGIFAWLWPH